MSATPDSTLADPQQRIADLERQLAEREAELAGALEQQTATAEVLQVINSSPGDLGPVFDAMLEKAMRLCGASLGGLWTYDGEFFHNAVIRGVTPALADFFAKPFRPAPGGWTDQLVRGASVLHSADIVADRRYQANLSTHKALVELGGLRALVSVPLRKDDILLGCITVYRQEAVPFSDKQIALLQNFAAQAVIAMENARLLTETRQRTAELQEALTYQTATSDVLNVISRSTADMQPVLETVVDTAARLCATYSATVLMREGEAYRYMASSFSATDPEIWALRLQQIVVPTRDSVAGRVALEGRVVQIPDIRITRCRRPWRPGDAPCLGCRSCATASRSDSSCFPVYGSSRSPTSRSN